MSAAAATLIAGGLAILGTWLGVMIERLMRLVGRLRGEGSGWELTFGGNDEGWGFTAVPIDNAEEHAIEARYRFAIDLFNGREVPTGLRDTRVELVRADGGEPFNSIPQDLDTARRGQFLPGNPGPVGAGIDDLKVVNLPPRQIVRKELEGTFPREATVALASGKWSKVEFVGELPEPPFFGLLGRKTFRCTITERN